ncbi:hypothetical protein BKA82DRAFT_3984206, partial [Pisolithus tinctorius]
NGCDIKFTELSEKIPLTYNPASSSCSFVPHYATFTLNKCYSKDTFDLHGLNLRNDIEHGASLTRWLHSNQNKRKKHVLYVEELLSLAVGENGSFMTITDMSRILSKRHADFRANNLDYSLSRYHKAFGNTNSSTTLRLFRGRTDDLHTLLLERRLPDGWESRIHEPNELTMLAFNRTVPPMERDVDESKWAAKDKLGAPTETVVPV